MPNNYFRFKQFTVRQDRCAMKVTTDACIFGAWVPVPEKTERVLDVGAGTGLLSLILAQRFPNLEIDAVEIDAAAAAQAAENIAASPFADRIRLHCADICHFQPRQSYEFIISNPPFFENALPGPDASRNAARHAGRLSPTEVFSLAQKHFKPVLGFAVLAPAAFRPLLEVGFAQGPSLAIKSIPEKPVHLHAMVVQRGLMQKPSVTELTVYSTYGVLTEPAAELLRPFYMNL